MQRQFSSNQATAESIQGSDIGSTQPIEYHDRAEQHGVAVISHDPNSIRANYRGLSTAAQ